MLLVLKVLKKIIKLYMSILILNQIPLLQRIKNSTIIYFHFIQNLYKFQNNFKNLKFLSYFSSYVLRCFFCNNTLIKRLILDFLRIKIKFPIYINLHCLKYLMNIQTLIIISQKYSYYKLDIKKRNFKNILLHN